MSRQQVVNGFVVQKDEDYRLQDAAGILGVCYATMKKYVHDYQFLKPRLLHSNFSVVDGAQLIYFHLHKREMFAKHRRLRRENRLVQTSDISEEWLKEPPIDDTWLEDKLAAFPMQTDPSLEATEEEDGEYYREEV